MYGAVKYSTEVGRANTHGCDRNRMPLLSKASNVVHIKYILYDITSFTHRRRTLKSTLHSSIFWEMVKFVALGVLYFSLVLPE